MLDIMRIDPSSSIVFSHRFAIYCGVPGQMVLLYGGGILMAHVGKSTLYSVAFSAHRFRCLLRKHAHDNRPENIT